ncbi:MAG: LPS-assembly protein LptD [Proteobacteria bacterium]|nr:LPS-assembly protein LptD [Pseudomonadota bacterium]
MRSLLLPGVVMLAAALPPPAHSQLAEAEGDDRSFTLTADEVVYDPERDLYEAFGNVRLVHAGGSTLNADWAVFNRSTRVGVAIGQVEFTDAGETLFAEFAAFDLGASLAATRNARIDSDRPAFRIQGETIGRTGQDRFDVERGLFTTCRCEEKDGRRPWEIEFQRADVELGGYAVGEDVWIKAFGVPVFYLPWIVFPAKTERQSGLLLPSFSSSSRNGGEFQVPLFVTLGERAQLTLRPEYMSRRGLKTALDLEYVFGAAGTGEGGVSGLFGDDRVDRDDPDTGFSDNRWAYWLRHEQPIAPGARIGLDIKEVSDNQYLVDFEDILSGDRRERRRLRFLESSAWASVARRGLYAGLESSVVDDLQSPDDLDRDDFLLQRLADLRVSSLPRSLGGLPLRLAIDSRYTLYRQLDGRRRIGERLPVGERFFDTGADGLFDEREPDALGGFPGFDVHRDNALPGALAALRRSEGDGIFQEGELLADDGHRLDLQPRLSLPLRFGAFETLSELGFRETLYFPDLGSTEQREVWTARFDVRTRLGREFRFRGRDWRHQIEPRLAFAAVSAPSQDDYPLFVPSASVRPRRLIDGDLRLLTRNPGDRLADARLLQFQLRQLLFARPAGPGSGGRQVGELRIGTSYDFEDSQLRRAFVQGRFALLDGLQFSFDAGYDPDRSQVDEIEAALDWLSGGETSLQLRYRYLREPLLGFEAFRRDDEIFRREIRDRRKISQIDFEARFRLTSSSLVFAEGRFSLEDSSSDTGRVGIRLSSACGCWELELGLERENYYSYTRRDFSRETRFEVDLNLSGLGWRKRGPSRD